MKILLISQYFYPEQFKCNDVATELVRRGHEVTVLTGIPNYPQGRFYDGYGLFSRRHERVNGADVHRVWQVPRGHCSALRLALNYFSFALTASFKVLWLALRHKYDAIIVHETSPITVGIPAVWVKKLQGIPLYFWVLDLWPESLTAAGGITNKQVLGFFTGMAKWIYRNSRRILISSRGFAESITQKGDFAGKLVYFPNWADRDLQQQTDYQLLALPEGFIVMFAGNIGEAQDFDHLMQAALLLKEERDIHFVLVGDGRKRPWVSAFIEQNGLQDTVHWLGRHPLHAMPAFFAKADAMLVSLKDELIFNLTAPAKLQAYMSAGKPILAMMNGEGPRVIAEAGCGASVPAGDAEGLAALIRRAAHGDSALLKQWGESGKAYCSEHFDLDKRMDALCEMLRADIPS